MNKLFLLAFIVTVVFACKNGKKRPTDNQTIKISIDSNLVTDSGWGVITPNTDYAGLQKIFGSANVKDERVCGPECADSIDVTFIYREQDNEIIVNWEDSSYHKKISFLETIRPNSPYLTSSGIKMGSTFANLLKLNGKKITFSGFGWDYGGIIQSYNGGMLENSSVHFRLEPTENLSDSLFGDNELNTDMPVVMKALDKIIVGHLSLSFHKPSSE